MNVLQAIVDAKVFAPWFQRGDWTAWTAFLAALFGLAMTTEQLAIYRACTGRTAPPTGASSEAALVIGRRGGKSFILALIAVFAACFRDYRPFLQPGERATVVVVAQDKRAARVIFRYIVALLEGVPMLDGLIERKTSEAIDLRRAVSIEVMTCSFRSLRGYAIPLALCDEAAFWQNEDSANPDSEVLAALRPAMAQFPDPMLLLASSPYARKGELWRAFKAHYGQDGAPVLVWRAATRIMNPSIPQSVVDAAFVRDALSAAAEYGAEFRSDIEQFISIEAVEAATAKGVIERAPVRDVTYHAGIDPSGGVRDSMVLAIAHRETVGDREVATLDLIREVRAPFRPADVVTEFVLEMRRYGCRAAESDRYAAAWPVEEFRRHGITLRPTRDDRSGLYMELIGPLNSGLVALLDNPRLASQLTGLERRTGRSGKDMIDHGTAAGSADDVANACAIALGMTLRKPKRERMGIGGLHVGERRYVPMPGRNLFM